MYIVQGIYIQYDTTHSTSHFIAREFGAKGKIIANIVVHYIDCYSIYIYIYKINNDVV